MIGNRKVIFSKKEMVLITALFRDFIMDKVVNNKIANLDDSIKNELTSPLYYKHLTELVFVL